MNSNLFYLQLSLISALLTMVIDYGLGQPGRDEFNIKALLFGYTYLVARRRLKRVGLYYEQYNQYSDQYKQAGSISERLLLEDNFKRLVVQQAKQYFVFEYAIGMCPMCTGFWITLVLFVTVNIFYFQVNIFTFTLYFLLSHLFIRLFNKL